MFEIEATIASTIGFASHQNAVPLLREVKVTLTGDALAEHLRLSLSADPPFVAPKTWTLDRLCPGDTLAIGDRDVTLNATLLSGLTESISGSVALTLTDRDGATVATLTRRVELLAHNEWGGLSSMAELLPAFVMPNDPAVDRVLKAASDALRRAGKPHAIDGYESKDKSRVWQIAAAIWAAVTGLKLSYALPPASFERTGQKVRTPGAIAAGRMATCLDTALLFAAALEQAGLNPLVIFTRGHAFTGVWLQPVEFANLLTDEAAALRRRIDLDDLLVFETTLATQSPPATFTQALSEARRQLAEGAPATFEMAIDIRRARMQRIRPLGVAVAAPERLADGDASADGLDEAPVLGGFTVEVEEAINAPADRVRQWQRKLLNLTTSNRLLHLADGAKALRLICPDPGALEDLLASGRKVRVTAMPDLEAGGRDVKLYDQQTLSSLRDEVAAQALGRGEALATLAKDKLDAALVELYRKARTDLEEGGANTLFLALGFLKWKKSAAEERTYRAPLILLPVRLERKSALSGVVMLQHEDEPRFNLTLLELLRQDFELAIPGLGGDLPRDSHGVDVAAVWRTVRTAVRDIPGFEVVPDTVLGTLSFAKYLMWKDLVDRADRLKESPLVRHLLERESGAFGDDSSLPRPDELDATVDPASLFTPLPADSSQLAAVVASARGQSFVLDGPPGCGKSQTIANMIAQNLALGRRVLFVAEKRAALDVVQRRLADKGLAPFCLELHSAKATKATVLKQLDRAWTTRDTLSAEDWAAEAAEARALRDELNAVVHLLHRVEPNGWSIHRAIGVSIRDGGEEAPKLRFAPGTRHQTPEMARLRDTARRLGLARAEVSDLPDDLAAITAAEWSPSWERELVTAATALPGALDLLDDARASLLEAVALPLVAGDRAGFGRLLDVARLLLSMHGHDLRFAFAPTMTDQVAAAREGLMLIEEYRAEEQALSARYAPEAARRIDIAATEAAWTEASGRWWIFATFAKRRVARDLARAGGANEVDPAGDLPRLARMRDLLGRLDAVAPRAAGVPGWAGLATAAPELVPAIARGERLRAGVAAAANGADALLALRAAVSRLVIDGNDLLAPDGPVAGTAARLETALQTFDAAAARFAALAGADAHAPLDALRGQAAGVMRHGRRLRDWTGWRRVRDDAVAAGLMPLIEALEAGGVAPGDAARLFEVAYAHWFAWTRIDEEPMLRRFAPGEQADRIARFQALDDRMGALTSRYVRARLCGLIPDKAVVGKKDGYGVLKHQLQLQRAHKPIRQLATEMGEAFTRLAPCMLMSPLSIAQYLPADQALFDLVIFDEASQITPWDAVGAMARGRQCVIAGDPRQMPPSNDFQRGAGATSDDDETEPDLASILEECLAAGVPQHSLDWHYRSRHESLIAFSNHRYYDSRLVTFPAPETRPSAVTWQRVPGVWARGAGRINEVEARAIVADAVRRLRDPSFVNVRGEPLTLGIITMNIEQMRLVEDLLDAARRAHPEIEPHFAEGRLEPVVVRNLETAQGDERDVILLGVGFGPTEPGGQTMSMSFGKLNGQGGWRRLNVAVTRARAEMRVFTSFDPGMIDLTRTSSDAVRDLKQFVEYAERGPRAIAEADRGSLGGADSPFEEAVAAELRRRGWQVVPQVGVSKFRIDLGVVHPDRPGDYLLGIECDGATYHSAATARDRDKVRQAILESLGWRLLRIWSTDWWANRARAADKLQAAMEAMLESDRAARAAAPAPAPPTPAAVEPAPVEVAEDRIDPTAPARIEETVARAAPAHVTTVQAPPDGRPSDLFGGPEPAPDDGLYRPTDFTPLKDQIRADLFAEADYRATLRRLIAHVVRHESPIAEQLLVQRIARAHGFQRAGNRIHDRIVRIARHHHHRCGDGFIWADQAQPAHWSRARRPAADAFVRQIEDIAPAELRAAASTDPVEIARLFGIRRLSAAARARIDRAVADGAGGASSLKS